MKRLALTALLLSLGFVVGCEKPAAKPKDIAAPAENAAAPTDPAAPADAAATEKTDDDMPEDEKDK